MPPAPAAPILGLDTATHSASVAVTDGAGRELADGVLDTSGRGDDLLVFIDDLCRKAGVAPRALGAVAVGAGPGSFTGLRIGMATAKGIAFGAGCPLWLVSSLGAMAAEAALVDRARGALVIPVLDARRNEVFCGFYDGDAPGSALAPERVLAPEELLATAQAAATTAGRSLVFCGDALAAFPDALAACTRSWMYEVRTPSALAVIRLALGGAKHDELVGGRPAYLRPAEAEVKYPDGVPGALRPGARPAS